MPPLLPFVAIIFSGLHDDLRPPRVISTSDLALNAVDRLSGDPRLKRFVLVNAQSDHCLSST